MARNELTKEQLGASYRIATVRLHELITEFFEELFDDKGDPREDSGNVANMVAGIRVMMNEELDLVKEASFEHSEANHDAKSKQETIFVLDGKSSRSTL